MDIMSSQDLKFCIIKTLNPFVNICMSNDLNKTLGFMVILVIIMNVS